MCPVCGSKLDARPESAVFVCPSCGRAFEPLEDELKQIQPYTADITSRLTVPPDVRYLAVWRFLASVEVTSRSTKSPLQGPPLWEQIRKIAAPEPPFLYVPSFDLGPMIVQQLGVSLVQAQPHLDLTPGVPEQPPFRLRLIQREQPLGSVHGRKIAMEDNEVGFGTVSPVLLSREDAQTVAHYVYLSLEKRVNPDLHAIDYDLVLTGGELVFLPAVYDRRYVRDSNWRMLLVEFDDIVA